MRGTPKIPRTERLGSRDSSSRVTRYATGEAPRQGDVVLPVGDVSGLIRCHYWVLGVSRYGWTSTTVNVQPILEPGADRERRVAVDAVVSRFRLVQRGATS